MSRKKTLAAPSRRYIRDPAPRGWVATPGPCAASGWRLATAPGVRPGLVGSNGLVDGDGDLHGRERSRPEAGDGAAGPDPVRRHVGGQGRSDAMKTVMQGVVWVVLFGIGLAAHAGTVYLDYTDPQGNVLAVADTQGHILARYDYRPYGGMVSGRGPDGPGYTGHVQDPETGLIYMQQRYDDPLGRFPSPDPVGPTPGNVFSFNRYAYADNNPIENIDPTGMFPGDTGDCSNSAFPCQVTYFEAGDNGGGGSDGSDSVSSSDQTSIVGRGQNSVNTPRHASTSERIAREMASDKNAKQTYLNKSLRTVTGDNGAPNIRPDVTVVNHDGTIDMVEVRSSGQTTASLVQKLSDARSVLGVGGKNIVVDQDDEAFEIGVRGTVMDGLGSIGVIEMIFHTYVDYKVEERQHPNETSKQREERKQWGACYASGNCT